jgi:hypothetical protein
VAGVLGRREQAAYFGLYNLRRRHQGLEDRTLDEVYWPTLRGHVLTSGYSLTHSRKLSKGTPGHLSHTLSAIPL